MKRTRLLCLAISIACAGSVQAQTCSGGTDGGMDATGSQCNAPGAFAVQDAQAVLAQPTVRMAVHPGRAAARVPVTKLALVARRPAAVPKQHARAQP